MDQLQTRLDALEQQMCTVNRRLRWWRSLALALLVLGLVSWNLPDVIAAAKPGLESRVAALESLLKHFSRDGEEITITGANLNLVNGLGAQADCGVQEATHPVCPQNGLGNLTIGYNERRGDGTDVRTGSHNLVMGRFNNYSGGTGNLIGGYFNEVVSHNSMIFGGSFNRLFGEASVLLSGNSNEIAPEGRWAGLFTGGGNRVENQEAAVFGGLNNTAAGGVSVIVGGRTTGPQPLMPKASAPIAKPLLGRTVAWHKAPTPTSTGGSWVRPVGMALPSLVATRIGPMRS
jgi:hypothetical protein